MTTFDVRRRGIVPYFFVTVTVIVTVIMILAMFIFYFCLKQQDKHCIRHYDCDYDKKIKVWVVTRLSKIFEQFDIRFASNFSNIKNTWFEHIQTLNCRIRFASIWTSNISNISNIFGKLSLAIIGLFLSLFFWYRSQQ